MRGAKATLAAVAALALAGAALAGAGNNQQGARPSAVAGSWLVNVNRGPALPPLSSLQSFSQGGTVVETANTVGVRGPSHGAWEHVRNRLYASTIVFFRFDPQGMFIGTQKIRRTLRVTPDGNGFTAVSISELRDASGNIVAENLRASETAQRITVERIPDVP